MIPSLDFPIFYPSCLVPGVLDALGWVSVANTQDFAGSPLPGRQRAAQTSGVSLLRLARNSRKARLLFSRLPVLLLWKTGRPTFTTLGKADSPIVSQKVLQAAKEFGFMTLGLHIFFTNEDF